MGDNYPLLLCLFICKASLPIGPPRSRGRMVVPDRELLSGCLGVRQCSQSRGLRSNEPLRGGPYVRGESSRNQH